MTDAVRTENEALENEEIRGQKEAEKKVNPLYKAVCVFINWFGFGSKLYGSNKHRKKVFFDVITYIILIVGALTMLYPFWWMLVASVNDSTYNMYQTVFWPRSVADGNIFYNYSRVISNFSLTMGGVSYWRIVLNTILYSVVPVVVGVIVSAAAAFAFAKIDFKGKNIVFFYCMFAIMIPFPALIVVQYCLYSELNWTTNGLAMIIPGCFGSVMTAFFIRQYLYSLPTSIIEAAKIDGAGYWRIFWRFIIPLGMPAIMAQGILSFMGAWNNYLAPEMFIKANSFEWYHMSVALSRLEASVSTNASFNMSQVIAASVLALVPVLILFGIFQKTIIGSIMLTGSKE